MVSCLTLLNLLLWFSVIVLLRQRPTNQPVTPLLRRRLQEVSRSREAWKTKAKTRRHDNKALQKRLRELTKSRDTWKTKAQQTQQQRNEARNASQQPCQSGRPKRHHYSLLIIRLVLLIKLQTSASFRAIEKIVVILSLHVQVVSETPSHTTITNWVYKLGYYELTRPKEQAQDWVILLDHSIQLGQDKLFVVWGIREEQIDFTRSLRYQDVTPLIITAKTSWTGATVQTALELLQREIGPIKYAIGDHSGELKKGLELAEIRQIHDITHAIALMMEKLYQDDETYQSLTTQMSTMRTRCSQSPLASIIPPRQRKKSRYQNLKTIADWAFSAIALVESLGPRNQVEQQQYDALQWMLSYKPCIEELTTIHHVLTEVERIVKCQGLSDDTVRQCQPWLKRLTQLPGNKGTQLHEQLAQYFQLSLKLVNESPHLICTSDILESAFGKYKNYLSHNPMAGVTNLALVISAFTSSLEQDEIKTALEQTTMNDIKTWTRKHIGPTLFAQRKALLSGRKEKMERRKIA